MGMGAEPPKVPEQVNVAVELYAGCLEAQTFADSSDFGKPLQEAELRAYVSTLDKNCLTWTFIWYAPLQGSSMDSWSKQNYAIFDKIRTQALTGYVVALLNGLPSR